MTDLPLLGANDPAFEAHCARNDALRDLPHPQFMTTNPPQATIAMCERKVAQAETAIDNALDQINHLWSQIRGWRSDAQVWRAEAQQLIREEWYREARAKVQEKQ